MLVGPPDPVSNLRPVLYNGLPDQTKTNAYSPQELRAHPIDPNKFELDLASQRIDKLNHEFWTEVGIVSSGGQIMLTHHLSE